MTTLPAPVAQAAFAQADAFARQALSQATLDAYSSDWRHFLAWCEQVDLTPLPASPETIAAYLGSMAESHARNTIQRRVIAIGQAHKLAGRDWRASHPVIRNTLRGMFRQHGRPERKAAALGLAEVSAMLAGCTGSLTALRDRALILIGFAGALRRSEIAGIHREHVSFKADGVRLLLPQSKTDQERQGVTIGIPLGANPDTCPVAALRRWIEASGCASGPVFRKVRADGSIIDRPLHPASVGRIIQARAKEAGIEADAFERVSSHGLRAGHITAAYSAGATDLQIMSHSRHKSAATMHGYVRRAKLMQGNTAKLLGL